MDEGNAEKALNLLIHDLRAPLSVAQGYLRLLQQNRLESADDRTRAITQTMEALSRIGRLCDDAVTFLAEPDGDGVPPTTVEVEVMVDRIDEACAELSAGRLPVNIEAEPLQGRFRAQQIDRIVQSLAVILCAVRRSSRDPSFRVVVCEQDNKAQFLLGGDEERAALVSRPPAMFDPWHGGHGIALPLACRVVTEAGGRIWTFAEARGAAGIVLPEEGSVP